ncbi:MAG: hypothetical protein JSV90_01095 [Methanobacteriota archaeon]|nr:MAG: hypothetical protein JSV90_01095 [Euryarchaeota archaeon]
MRSVDFGLTEAGIRKYLAGRSAYIRTRYIAFNSGDSWAVVKVRKRPVNRILQPIESVDIVALPEDTNFMDEPCLDVLSASAMGALRESAGKRCVVVRGRADHVSFFVDEEPLRLTIFDVVPPTPTKLVDLVDEALRSHLQNMYMKYAVDEVDIRRLEGLSEAESVLFPCRASGLEHSNGIGYLDATPSLDDDVAKNTALVGCSLSARIFEALYGVEPNLVNMCPVDLLEGSKPEGPVLTKCCKVKEGCELRGDVAIVPWGARVGDVAIALQKLFG